MNSCVCSCLQPGLGAPSKLTADLAHHNHHSPTAILTITAITLYHDHKMSSIGCRNAGSVDLNPPRSTPTTNPSLHPAYLAPAPPLPSSPPPCTVDHHPPSPATPAFVYTTHRGPTPRYNTATEIANGGDGPAWLPVLVRHSVTYGAPRLPEEFSTLKARSAGVPNTDAKASYASANGPSPDEPMPVSIRSSNPINCLMIVID